MTRTERTSRNACAPPFDKQEELRARGHVHGSVG
jgi:hypothetical protein